jgi:hypothetical protein
MVFKGFYLLIAKRNPQYLWCGWFISLTSPLGESVKLAIFNEVNSIENRFCSLNAF